MNTQQLPVNTISILVSYGSLDRAKALLKSLPGSTNHQFVFCENHPSFVSDDQKQPFQENENTKLLLYPDNPGYFGAIHRALESLPEEVVDRAQFLLVGNVDLIFADDFFANLEAINIAPGVGALAPSILSERTHRDQNPYVLKRPSSRYFKKLIMIYKWWPVGFAYQLARLIKYIALKKTVKANAPVNEITSGAGIYAGHGSLMIFTQSFLKRGGHFRLPNFLFGEELFIAEQLRNNGLIWAYHPELKVNHTQHESLGSWPNRQKLLWQKDATESYRKYCRS